MDNLMQNTNSNDIPSRGSRDMREGPIARTIEKQTAKVPSDLFLWAAGASIVGSAVLQILGSQRTTFFGARRAAPMSNFVGMWAPTILLLGVYNKIVKVAGSDRSGQASGR